MRLLLSTVTDWPGRAWAALARTRLGVFLAKVVELLRNPPDLIERAVIIEFILAIYPDYTARITATKLSGPKPEEIQNITNAGIAALLAWAKGQGVELKLNPPAPPAPAKLPSNVNPLKGVRP